jgi:hypothetical protein
MQRASIGVSAHLGWAATAIVACDRQALRVLRSDRIQTAPDDDRDISEPYHVAGGFDGLRRVPPPANPKEVVRSGLRKQQRYTARVLAGVAKQLADQGHRLAFGGILVSRGREARDFEKAIGSHTQIHIQEGLAVRESLRSALRDMGARVHDIDQKSVLSIGSAELDEKESELMAQLGATRPENDAAWRKEEKLAALAAWIAWRRGGR